MKSAGIGKTEITKKAKDSPLLKKAETPKAEVKAEAKAETPKAGGR